MAPENAAFSSVHMKERDRMLEGKHRKELEAIEKRIENLKKTTDDTRKQLYDVANRGERLARCLGFEDVFEAQSIIDMVDHAVPYKDCLERVQILELELSVVRKENAGLKETHEEKIRQDLELKSAHTNLQSEHKKLKETYEALITTHRRAAERYKQDYKKWRDFDRWLFSEDKQHRIYRNEEGITPLEKKRRDAESINRKMHMMIERGPELARHGENHSDGTPQRPPPLGRTEMQEDDKENSVIPVSPKKPRQASSESNYSSSTSSRTPHAPNPQLQRIAKDTSVPSSSPTIFNKSPDSATLALSSSTRVPLSFRTIPNTKPHLSISEEVADFGISENVNPLTSSAFSPSSECNQSRPSLKRPLSPTTNYRVGNSSDTQEYSQSPVIVTMVADTSSIVFKLPPPPLARSRLNTGGSSDTEDDSQAPDPTPLPQREPRRPSLLERISMNPPGIEKQNNGWQHTADRPTKMRRLNQDAFENDSTTPRPHQRNPVLPGRTQAPRTDPGKGKERQVDTSTTQGTRSSGPKGTEDYSVFKGRGRYATAAGATSSARKTINAQYQIDPTQNGGLNYPYDEVVRNQGQRRQMDAGDCECCRDYYDAVGPLPNRLKQPLWRSPTATPEKSCPRHSNPNSSTAHPEELNREHDKENHKKAISRHRHTWARASTPPGYWNIGFPSTQEVGDINDKAEEMHNRKLQEVEKEVGRSNGRYKRR